MRFHDSLKQLEEHDTFLTWRKDNPDHYLAHGFLMLDPNIKPEWQVGYYSTKDDRMVTFSVDYEGNVTLNPPSEIFKKDAKVRKLDAAKVSQDAQVALNDARKYQQEHYKGHDPARTIILLQHLERGQVWNITFVTATFAVCNIKLDAATHKVLHASCESLLAWGDAQPGNRRKD